jgi:alginate O-acetyltransferase complex protein AlgJ
MMAQKIQALYNLLLVSLFIGLLSAPAIKMIRSEKMAFSLAEKRALASIPRPPESLSQLDLYFSDLGTYLDDHFGFRELLIYRYQRESRKRFGITGDETNTHQGVNSWFYLGQSEMLSDFAGKKQLPESKMKDWAARYHAKKQWLEQHGIQYLLVIPPDKESVYPEFVMDSWEKFQGKSKLQQLIEAYPEINETELLDLGSRLKKYKEEPLFYKSDTHWTPFGAYTAYLIIAEKIEQKFPSTSFKKDFAFSNLQTRHCSPEENNCGDLTKMLLDFEPFEESSRKLLKFKKCSFILPADYSLTNLPAEVIRSSITSRCDQSDLKAVIFRDSFSVALEPFFSENFKQVVYLWKEYDQNNVEEILTFFKADIVIEEVVERNFLLN